MLSLLFNILNDSSTTSSSNIVVNEYSATTTVSTSEYFLPNYSTTATAMTVPGLWETFLDLSTLVDGDVLQFKVY